MQNGKNLFSCLAIALVGEDSPDAPLGKRLDTRPTEATTATSDHSDFAFAGHIRLLGFRWTQIITQDRLR